MTEHDTFERLRTLVCETLEHPHDSVQPSSALRELGATSLDLVEIATHVEDAFGVTMTEKDMATLLTMHDVVTFIDRARSAAP